MVEVLNPRLPIKTLSDKNFKIAFFDTAKTIFFFYIKNIVKFLVRGNIYFGFCGEYVTNTYLVIAGC